MARARLYPSVRLITNEPTRGPWIYARNVAALEERVEDGALVEVLDASRRFLGHAFYNGRSDIRLRLVAEGRRGDLDRPERFFEARLRAADNLRRRGLGLAAVTNAYRVAHAEGDDLPGLVVDRFADTLVCEYHALGFWRAREVLETALGRIFPGAEIVARVPPSAARSEGFEAPPAGPAPREVWIEEHGLRYPVVPGTGHKTGWFCDQRDNRQRIASFAAGKDVLDLCCNAGGFALSAARAGARRVRAVDLDEVALERARRAGEENGLDVEWRHADGFDVLREVASERGPRPELVVLDPHKLIPNRSSLELGKKKYGDWNALALGALAPGGLLATFSCSGALDLPGFLGIVFGAARRAGREVRLLEILGAAPDHPQRPDWPRSRYLKGALLALAD